MGTKVAIIGGGAAAAFVITELLEHGVGMPAELHWYSGRRGGSRCEDEELAATGDFGHDQADERHRDARADEHGRVVA